jgi:hypothetical protein
MINITKENMIKKEQEYLLYLQNKIDKEIEESKTNGKFKCEIHYNSNGLSKKNKEYIKSIYLEKGYKIKFKFYWPDEYSDTENNRKIKINWKYYK